MPRAVLFDLDNTLYVNDEEQEAEGLRAIGSLNHQDQEALQHLLLQAAHTHKSRMLAEYDASCGSLGPEAQETGRKIITDWMLPMDLEPDASLLLDQLEAKSIRFGLITNAPPIQWLKIICLGLHQRAAVILVSGELGIEKPNPAIFSLAADRLGAKASELMMVGDCMQSDVQGGCAAGMQAAWICRNGIPAPLPDLPQQATVIERLTELLPLF